MSAPENNVVSLDSHRPEPPPAVSCCRCQPGAVCYSHRVANLADVLRTYGERHEGDLLTTTTDVDQVLDHALDVLARIVAETLPNETRSAR